MRRLFIPDDCRIRRMNFGTSITCEKRKSPKIGAQIPDPAPFSDSNAGHTILRLNSERRCRGNQNHIRDRDMIADLTLKQKVLIASSLLIAKFLMASERLCGKHTAGNPSRYLPFLGSQSFWWKPRKRYGLKDFE